ncbi:MAG: NAD(P)-dependent oxidoreductase [Betaproteobacteria bacterium]
MTMATVLIVGASRGIGLATLKCALKAGHRVRALARSAARIPVNHPDLTKIAGDALDQAAVTQALTGVDAVIQTLGVTPGPEQFLKPAQLFSKATRILIRAMEEAGVKRLICLTGFGAGDSRNKGGFLYNIAFQLFLRRIYDDKNVQEQLIEDSNLDWVIVRPVILKRTGNRFLSGSGRSQRLAMWVCFPSGRCRFPGQASERRYVSEKSAGAGHLSEVRSLPLQLLSHRARIEHELGEDPHRRRITAGDLLQPLADQAETVEQHEDATMLPLK